MSVLVKGMEMPENCWQCVEKDLNIAISVFGGICPFCVKIVFAEEHNMKTGRHPECPLVALPDKHGRLVDADELIKKYGDWYTEEGTEEGYIGSIKDLLYYDAPTIVESEDSE